MKRKRKLLFCILVFVLLVLTACGGSESEESDQESGTSGFDESEEAAVNRAYQVGEPMEILSESDDGKMNVTITDWGTDYDTSWLASGSILDGLNAQSTLYIDYEVENTGSSTMVFDNSEFSIYADDHVVEQSYGEKAASMTRVSPGRKASARLYGAVDPSNVSNIEIEYYGAIIAIKGENVSQEGFKNQLLTPDEVQYASAASEPLTGLSGYYQEAVKSENNVEIEMYSYEEGGISGTAKIQCGWIKYEGELAEIDTNIYQLIYNGGNEVVVSFLGNGYGEKEVCVYAEKLPLVSARKIR